MAAAGVGDSVPAGRPVVLEQRSLTYARVDGMELRAELYRPTHAADRLRQALVMVHGGAWTVNDRLTPEVVSVAFARRGMTVFSLDFRDGRNGKHPCAVRDIAAGIRYVRANAAQFEVDPGCIGLIGSSSGGHLVLLTGIQPDVPAHRGTPFAIDGEFRDADVSAAVGYVIALWPVSDPLARFRYARASGREELVAAHLRYYRDEEHMAEASVQRTLAQGEAQGEGQTLPPLLVVQPGADRNVPQEMTLDLLREYQRAGGDLQYLFYPGLPHAFAYQASPETDRLLQDMWPFVEGHCQGGD